MGNPHVLNSKKGVAIQSEWLSLYALSVLSVLKLTLQCGLVLAKWEGEKTQRRSVAGVRLAAAARLPRALGSELSGARASGE